MPLFAVSRRHDPRGPLLVLAADNAEKAVEIVKGWEEIGALAVRGYYEASDGYIAQPADDAQEAKWAASVEAAIERGKGAANTHEPEWLAFLRPPEFTPPVP